MLTAVLRCRQVLGGTLLRVYGSHLFGSADSTRLCRVGTSGVAVEATFYPVHSAILCTTPPLAGGGGGLAQDLPLQVSLNGRHFTNTFDPAHSTVRLFSTYEPPLPHALLPTSGYGNGTLVTINGTGLARAGAFCRFGNALVNATVAPDDRTLRCLAPRAATAGAWSRLALDFSEPWPVGGVFGAELDLHGVARVEVIALPLSRQPLHRTRRGGPVPPPACPSTARSPLSLHRRVPRVGC